MSARVENTQSGVRGLFTLKWNMTTCRFLVSDGTLTSKAFCFCVSHYITCILFHGCALRTRSRARGEGRASCAAGAGLRRPSQGGSL